MRRPGAQGGTGRSVELLVRGLPTLKPLTLRTLPVMGAPSQVSRSVIPARICS